MTADEILAGVCVRIGVIINEIIAASSAMY